MARRLERTGGAYRSPSWARRSPAAKLAFGELNVSVSRPRPFPRLLEFLKTDPDCQFSTLVDITGVDHPERAKRFDVVYHLLSMYTEPAASG